MKIAVTGGKGGTGKSMVATSIAVEFAKSKRVLLVDADVECPNDHLLLSIKLKRQEIIRQPIPKWDLDKCNKCGKCAAVCKQNAIAFVKGKHPAFLSDLCIGCKACIVACPEHAIGETKKEIGTVYTGKNYGVTLVSGELKLGELASGEVVSELRNHADKVSAQLASEIMIIDSAAGVGCPVIASLKGSDYVVAVTEPTPSALHDLERVLFLSDKIGVPSGIVLNKFDLEKSFCSKIEDFAKKKGIPIIGRIPYRHDFVEATIKMKPVVEINPAYADLFAGIAQNAIAKKGGPTGKAQEVVNEEEK